MPKLAPPHLVRTLMARGCTGEFGAGTRAFDPDESAALVRYLARLLADRRAESGDSAIETIVAIGTASAERHRPELPLACARGCASCCHQAVSVSAPEAFAIARRVRRAKDSATLRAALAARPPRIDRDPQRQFDAARPCAFLSASACSIHAFRPAACRSYVSLDVAACLRRLDAGHGSLPVPHAAGPVRQWLDAALWAAHRAAGLTPRSYDMAGAVAAALADPGLEARWYAGDDGLAAEADPPFPAVMPEVEQLRRLARI